MKGFGKGFNDRQRHSITGECWDVELCWAKADCGWRLRWLGGGPGCTRWPLPLMMILPDGDGGDEHETACVHGESVHQSALLLHAAGAVDGVGLDGGGPCDAAATALDLTSAARCGHVGVGGDDGSDGHRYLLME